MTTLDEKRQRLRELQVVEEAVHVLWEEYGAEWGDRMSEAAANVEQLRQEIAREERRA